MSNFISLQTAIDMTTLYRKEREEILQTQYQNRDILAKSETFEKDQILKLLAKQGCEKLRVYYGMDGELKVHAILVPVNANNEDILPEKGILLDQTVDEDILDNGMRCPPDCSAPSPLNP